jgi:putative sigma-54 modulation protein
VEKTSDKENKIVEVKVNVPGDDFMVKNNAKLLRKGLNYRQNLWSDCWLKGKKR